MLQNSVIAPPGPEGLPILGKLPEMHSKGIIKFYYDLWLEYGDIVHLKLGPMNTYLLVHPDHIQHVLVKHPDTYVKGLTMDKLRLAIGHGILTLEGETWQQRRRLMQPTYTPRNIRQFTDIMLEEAQTTAERWHRLGSQVRVDINEEMTRTTMAVISRSMFGFDISDDFKEVGDALHEFLAYAVDSTMSILDVPLFIPTPRNQRLKRAKQVVREFVMGIIEKRRRDGYGDDLLSMLMTATDEESGQTLTDDELHDEVLITFFAGHETTATLMTWAWYLLARYPHVAAQLHAELDEKIGGTSLAVDDLKALPYTRMVLDETLRLYSPVAVTARDVAHDDVIDGYHIPRGSMVLVMPYITHRHPHFWDHPMAFYPEHFTPERIEQRPRYAYYPFGAGRRICIGSHFAEMESAILLAHLAKHFTPELAVPNNGGVDFLGVVRPEEPILMTLIPR